MVLSSLIFKGVKYISLLANRLASVVLPLNFGPTIATLLKVFKYKSPTFTYILPHWVFCLYNVECFVKI